MGRVDGPHSSSVLRTDTAHCPRLHSLAHKGQCSGVQSTAAV
jgi:hypothetical protein